MRALRVWPQGSSVQRNAAIPFADTPYALFLDDDVELGPGYIEQMEQVFARDPSIAAASGKIVADGAKDGKGIDRQIAIHAILSHRPFPAARASRSRSSLDAICLSAAKFCVSRDLTNDCPSTVGWKIETFCGIARDMEEWFGIAER